MRRRAFTLAELLVVMAIVAVIATITVIAVGDIARGARVSSGRNALTAALETARSYAMKHNTVTLVTFRAAWNPAEPQIPQRTEIVVARWTGESGTILRFNQPLWNTLPGGTHWTRSLILDRFEPIPDVPARTLPEGIKVAGPWYDRTSQTSDYDSVWVTQPDFRELAASNENPGRFFGVLYGPEGDVRTQLTESGADDLFVDFDRDGLWDVGTAWPGSSTPWYAYDRPPDPDRTAITPSDEYLVNPAPFLTVFDDEAAREVKTLDWASEANYTTELTGPDGYISRYADRIHFNRYSGVVLR